MTAVRQRATSLVFTALAVLAASASFSCGSSPRPAPTAPSTHAEPSSCPTHDVAAGPCVDRVATVGRHCGPDTVRTPVVVARRPAAPRDASLWARLERADEELERHLAVPLAQRHDELDRLRAGYTALAQLGELGGVAAKARLGTMSHLLADELFAAPIPATVVDDDGIDRFCDDVTARAEPLEKRAVAELAACVAEAGRIGRARPADASVGDMLAWSRACAKELAELAPERYPALDEMRSSAWSPARIQLELRNFDEAARLASADTYDDAILRGIALRGAGSFDKAEVAYRRALALDPARPEAYFDLGLLEHARSTRSDVAVAVAVLDRATAWLDLAATHGAAQAPEYAQLTRKTIAQIQQFIAAQHP